MSDEKETIEMSGVTPDDPVVKHLIESSDPSWTITRIILEEKLIVLDKHAPRQVLHVELKDPEGKEHLTNFNYLKALRKLKV